MTILVPQFQVLKRLKISKAHLENLTFHEIHIWKISFFTKFTFSKSDFSQNSHFQISFFTKFTISNSHFSQNSQFQIRIFH